MGESQSAGWSAEDADSSATKGKRNVCVGWRSRSDTTLTAHKMGRDGRGRARRITSAASIGSMQLAVPFGLVISFADGCSSIIDFVLKSTALFVSGIPCHAARRSTRLRKEIRWLHSAVPQLREVWREANCYLESCCHRRHPRRADRKSVATSGSRIESAHYQCRSARPVLVSGVFDELSIGAIALLRLHRARLI